MGARRAGRTGWVSHVLVDVPARPRRTPRTRTHAWADDPAEQPAADCRSNPTRHFTRRAPEAQQLLLRGLRSNAPIGLAIVVVP